MRSAVRLAVVTLSHDQMVAKSHDQMVAMPACFFYPILFTIKPPAVQHITDSLTQLSRTLYNIRSNISSKLTWVLFI